MCVVPASLWSVLEKKPENEGVPPTKAVRPGQAHPPPQPKRTAQWKECGGEPPWKQKKGGAHHFKRKPRRRATRAPHLPVMLFHEGAWIDRRDCDAERQEGARPMAARTRSGIQPGGRVETRAGAAQVWALESDIRQAPDRSFKKSWRQTAPTHESLSRTYLKQRRSSPKLSGLPRRVTSAAHE